MATVTKDFKIKSGLVVEGTNGTINGSDIITEDAITAGNGDGNSNITVSYDAVNKKVTFEAAPGYTDQEAVDAVAAALSSTGAIVYENDEFKVQVGNGITRDTENNRLVVARGDGLELDVEGALKINNGAGLHHVQSGEDTRALAVNLGTSQQNGIIFNENNELELDLDVVASLLTNASQTNISITGDGNGLTITAENGVADSTTDNLAEGTTNLYFTDERAVNAVSASATPNNNPDTIVKRDSSGNISVNELGANSVGTIDVYTERVNGQGGTLNLVAASGIYVNDPYSSPENRVATQGDIDTHSDLTTGVHGVTGDVVGTTDTQTLSNKTLGNDLDAGGYKIVDLAAPEQADDAATKAYVDSVAEGLHVHASAAAATTGNITISSGTTIADVDGVPTYDGMRILVKDQADPAQNGIYVLLSQGGNAYNVTRAADFNSPAEVDGGDFIFVTGGNTYADTGWVQTADQVLTIGVDPIVFTQFSGAGTYLPGYGLNLDGNTFEVDATEIASQTDLNNAVSDLTDAINGYLDPSTGTTIEYIDDQDAATLLAANGYSDALVAAGDATATPTYLALDINDVAKQVAATVGPVGTTQAVAYAFAKADYRSAKFLVKVAYGSHTEVSEVILTLDSSDNIAITEYAVVSTNGSASAISAGISGSNVQLLVTPVNANSTISVFGTLISATATPPQSSYILQTNNWLATPSGLFAFRIMIGSGSSQDAPEWADIVANPSGYELYANGWRQDLDGVYPIGTAEIQTENGQKYLSLRPSDGVYQSPDDFQLRLRGEGAQDLFGATYTVSQGTSAIYPVGQSPA